MYEPPEQHRDVTRVFAASEDRILDAIVTEIAETGLAGLSIDRVAARAAVSKTTIYNRWRTKDELVVAAFAAVTKAPIEFTLDRGLPTALRQMFEYGRQLVSDRRLEALLAELLASGHSNDDVRRLVDDFRLQWHAATTAMLSAACAAGELPPDTDIAFLAEVLAALMTYRTVSPSFDEAFDEQTFRRIEALVMRTPPRRLR